MRVATDLIAQDVKNQIARANGGEAKFGEKFAVEFRVGEELDEVLDEPGIPLLHANAEIDPEPDERADPDERDGNEGDGANFESVGDARDGDGEEEQEVADGDDGGEVGDLRRGEEGQEDGDRREDGDLEQQPARVEDAGRGGHEPQKTREGRGERDQNWRELGEHEQREEETGRRGQDPDAVAVELGGAVRNVAGEAALLDVVGRRDDEERREHDDESEAEENLRRVEAVLCREEPVGEGAERDEDERDPRVGELLVDGGLVNGEARIDGEMDFADVAGEIQGRVEGVDQLASHGFVDASFVVVDDVREAADADEAGQAAPPRAEPEHRRGLGGGTSFRHEEIVAAETEERGRCGVVNAGAQNSVGGRMCVARTRDSFSFFIGRNHSLSFFGELRETGVAVLKI